MFTRGAETPKEDLMPAIQSAQESTRGSVANTIGGIVDTTLSVGVGTGKVLAYGSGRAIRGVFEVGNAIKKGLEANPYPQAA